MAPSEIRKFASQKHHTKKNKEQKAGMHTAYALLCSAWLGVFLVRDFDGIWTRPGIQQRCVCGK
jgi:hypothetical protein